MNNFVQNMGGIYRRYSDDILVVVPGNEVEGRMVEKFATDEIRKFGSTLEIKPSKTMLVVFSPSADGSLSAFEPDKPRNRDGLQYLGFRFTGKKTFIRNTTLAKYYRGITYAARRQARMLVKRHVGKEISFLKRKFNLTEFERRFGKVAQFHNTASKRSWTFRTYIKRCSEVFSQEKQYFFRQTRNYQRKIKQLAENELSRALRSQRN